MSAKKSIGIQLNELFDRTVQDSAVCALILSLETELETLNSDLDIIEREIDEIAAELAYQDRMNDIADRYNDMKLGSK
jgi:hypothetical protein